MAKKMPDKIIEELKETISRMELDSMVLVKNINLYGDTHLSHIVKITVGTIQAIRMYVLTNQDVLKNLLVKESRHHGKKSSKAARKDREDRTGTALNPKGI